MADLTGRRFGRLVVVGKSHKNENRLWFYECVCDCGEERIIRGNSLTQSKNPTRSCGCLQREHAVRSGKNAKARNVIRHAMSRTRFYKIWSGMKERCNNPNSTEFSRYGGRGITYDPRWERFENFFEDMKEDYKDDLTLDRIDYNGNYTKENCRWADFFVQNRNTSFNRIIEFDGIKRTLAEWAEISGINYQTLRGRLNRGKDVGDALKTPVQKKKRGCEKVV